MTNMPPSAKKNAARVMNEFDDLADIDSRDALFIAYLEGDLSPEQRQALRADLLSDPEFRREFDAFKDIMGATRALPLESASPDFVNQVQARIRTGSHGRFFGSTFVYGAHTPYEAISVAMIALMAAAWIFLGAPRDHGLRYVDVNTPPQLETSSSASTRY